MTACDHSGVKKRCGFTLLEMLAALVLASLLMTAVLKLLGIMHAQERSMANSVATDQPWIPRVFRLLERDCRNSRRMIVGTNEFHLTGFAATDRETSAANYRPAEVAYRVLLIHGQLCLQREERKTDSLSNNSIVRELIAVDVAGISLWFADAPDVNWASESSSTAEWIPIPRAIVVQLDVRTTASLPTSEHRKFTEGDRIVADGTPALTPQRRVLLLRTGAN